MIFSKYLTSFEYFCLHCYYVCLVSVFVGVATNILCSITDGGVAKYRWFFLFSSLSSFSFLYYTLIFLPFFSISISLYLSFFFFSLSGRGNLPLSLFPFQPFNFHLPFCLTNENVMQMGGAPRQPIIVIWSVATRRHASDKLVPTLLATARQSHRDNGIDFFAKRYTEYSLYNYFSQLSR